jgi:hypothetical protein
VTVANNDRLLLTLDAAVNLALGVLLVFFPRGIIEWLGLPTTDLPFYASILGAVLVGIGLALLIERLRDRTGVGGLGLGGAICINACGAGVLAVWLLTGTLGIPLRGYLLLWAIAVIVLGLAFIELRAQLRRS